MNIIVTGSNSGIGKSIVNFLDNHTVHCFSRKKYNMDIPGVFKNCETPDCDLLFNVAGHDLGGKVDFLHHNFDQWSKILNTNLVNTLHLTQLVLQSNINAKIINITSTNVDQYYPNDLIYSLSKSALSTFTDYLRIEYPDRANNFKEVRLGLTKTNFVNNRHRENHIPNIDLYSMYDHLLPDDAAEQIINFAFSNEQRIWIKK